MNEFKQAKPTVERILRSNFSARQSDDLLYILVCTEFNQEATCLSLVEALTRRKELGLPCYETVRRVRQKAQEEYPELRSCKEVLDAKYNKYKQAKEFANE